METTTRQEKRFRRTWTTQNPRSTKKSRVDEKLVVVLHRLPIAVVPKKPDTGPHAYFSLEMEIHNEIEGRGRAMSSIDEKYDFEKCPRKVTQLVASSLTDRPDKSVLWVGCPGNYIEDPVERDKVTQKLIEQYNCYPVWIKDDLLTQYCNFANGILWPLFHYQEQDMTWTRELKYYDAYRQATALYSQVLLNSVGLIPDKDLIWIHDYYLILLPKFIRAKLPNARMGFFLHTPFPSSELFRILPSREREELLLGFLNSKLVGFQTFDHARHFSKTCTRILGVETESSCVFYDDRTISVGVFPAGIDPSKLEAALATREVQERTRQLQEKYAGKKILLAVDRLDVVKGIPQKLYGLQHFYSQYPEWQGQVTLIQIALPSSIEVKGHKKIEREVNELVGRTNSEYSSLQFVPVCYMNHSISLTELCALYSVADVLLVTSLRGGLGSVPQEYVVCQKERHGVLILSEFVGAAQSLGSGALLINPWNSKDIAKAINSALTFSPEIRKAKGEMLYKQVSNHTSRFWAESFIKALQLQFATSSIENSTDLMHQVRCSPAELTRAVLTSYHGKSRRVLVFGLDGILVPYSKLPEIAAPTQQLMESLQKLVNDPKNTVVVMSGRTREKMSKLFSSLPGLGIAAENGFFYRPPYSEEWEQLIPDDELDLSWKEAVLPIFIHFTDRTPGTILEEKEVHLTWYYRNTDDVEYGKAQSRNLQIHLEGNFGKWPIRTDVDHQKIEVGPNKIDIAALVKRILSGQKTPSQSPNTPHHNQHNNNTHGDNSNDFVLYVGNNSTASKALFEKSMGNNENEFLHGMEVVTALVGKKTSQASFYLNNSNDVVDLVDSLTVGFFVF